MKGVDEADIVKADGTRLYVLHGQKFLIDLQVPAFGEQRKYLLSFSGEKLHLRFEDGDGRVVSVDGGQGD